MDKANKISWEAHDHIEEDKSSDWYWVVSIIAAGMIVLAIFFGNFLLGILIMFAVLTLFMQSKNPPKVIHFEINRKGIQAGEILYPYQTLESFFIVDEDGFERDRILVKSRKPFMPLLVFPLSKEVNQEEVSNYLLTYLNEEALSEPTIYKIVKTLGL